MPRWKAWLCRFGMPGRRMAWRSSPGCGAASASTRAMRPPSTASRTSSLPAVRQQGLFRKDRCHGLSSDCTLRSITLASIVDMYIHNAIGMEMEKIDGRHADEAVADVAHLAQCPAGDALPSAAGPGHRRARRGRRRSDGRIVFAGPEADMPAALRNGAEIIDCEGRWITPGLIDCHTHLVHAGNRANEFEMRLAGATYEEVARAGGGIVSSVKALRAASEDELVAQTLPRLDALIAEGVTTIEIKSGYGLDLENEAKSLRAARRLGERAAGDRASRRFLGAHALPPEANGDKDAYIAKVVDEMLPAIAARRAGRRGRRLLRRHRLLAGADRARVRQRRRRSACRSSCMPTSFPICMAPRWRRSFGALSADHLEYTDEAGAAAMAKAGTVAVLLPGAFYFIRETKKPPVDAVPPAWRARWRSPPTAIPAPRR